MTCMDTTTRAAKHGRTDVAQTVIIQEWKKEADLRIMPFFINSRWDDR